MWRLVGRMGGLELNSCYAYVLLATHFADTCVVATREDRLAGFVVAYRPPTDLWSVFVWQIGVAPEARGVGLATRLLDLLLARPTCRDARYLTATVSPDNSASLNLFKGLARRRGVGCQIQAGFPAALFSQTHADEDLLRIGPLTQG